MKRLSCAVVLFAVFLMYALGGASETVYASSVIISEIKEDARRAELYVSCDSVSDVDLAPLTDDSQYSRYSAAADTQLKFRSSVPVRSLYMMFDRTCAWRILLPDGTEFKAGEEGFLHEYVDLGKETADFELDVPAGSAVTEVYAFTDGNLPDWVQLWEPPCKRADLMLMPTHADDEHLWFGGAMPYYAGELGYRVQVVFLTHHAKERYRSHELLNGLWKVGVRNYPVITDRFPDDKASKDSLYDAEALYGRDRATEFTVEMLRRFAPRVIIGHDIAGEYGHGAHQLYASVLLDALKIYDNPSVYPESAAAYGTHKVQKCYLHLWSENQITVQWSDKILEHFDGKSALEVAREGYSCHRSQQKWVHRVLEFGNYDCRKFGLVYTSVGYDTPGLNDMFEHVNWSDRTDAETGKTVEPEMTVSDSDAEKKVIPTVPSREYYVPLFGRNIKVNDVVFAGTAMVLSLAAIIIVICLKRRE